jgi:ribosomal-protein-alanine N-acetyltransferase
MIIPILKTKNLILRELRKTDLQDLYALRKDPSLHLYTDSLPDKDILETKNYLQKMVEGTRLNKWIIWGIELKSEVRLIGTISIWNFNRKRSIGELGYGIDYLYRNQGYMKEALVEVSKYAFEDLKMEALNAYTEVNNIPSIRLLEGLGFKKITQILEIGQITKSQYQMLLYQLEGVKDEEDIL